MSDSPYHTISMTLMTNLRVVTIHRTDSGMQMLGTRMIASSRLGVEASIIIQPDNLIVTREWLRFMKQVMKILDFEK